MPVPHHSVFTGWMPFLLPIHQHQRTEGTADRQFSNTYLAYNRSVKIKTVNNDGISVMRCSNEHGVVVKMAFLNASIKIICQESYVKDLKKLILKMF